jgi:hypothetical protein
MMEASNATMNDAVHGGSQLLIHGMVQPTIFLMTKMVIRHAHG